MMRETFKEWYLNRFPDEINGRRRLGVEGEYIALSGDNQAGDFRQIFPALLSDGWLAKCDDVYPNEVLGCQEVVDGRPTGNVIETDAGWCTPEIVVRPCSSLQELKEEYLSLTKLAFVKAQELGLTILNYGIQPETSAGEELWIKKRRHQVIAKNYPRAIHGVTTSASLQVQVEITKKEMVPALNILGGISGLCMALAANAPVYNGQLNESKAKRELIWDSFSYEGRIGIPPRITGDIDHLIDVVTGQMPLIYKRGHDYEFVRGQYDFFGLLKEFVTARGIELAQDIIFLHEGTLWWTARLRTLFGTIEFRPCCQQPREDKFAIPALILGLIENLERSKSLIDGIDHENLRQLRLMAAEHGMAFDARLLLGCTLQEKLSQMIVLAKEGLQMRGLDEEVYLEPLDRRVKDSYCPADSVIAAFNDGGVSAVVEHTRWR